MATRTVKRRESNGTPEKPIAVLPQRRRAVLSGAAEPVNLSFMLDVDQIQSALRAAERGDTWRLFTIYRDMLIGYSHLQAEWTKRKMVILGPPHALIPKRKDNADDKKAAEVIQQMIDHCENWMDGLSHLLDATLYPVSAVEKIFSATEDSERGEFDTPIRYKLAKLSPISYTLLCFKLPYQRASMLPNTPYTPFARGNGGYAVNGDNYDPDAWESDLRFYDTDPLSGFISWQTTDSYAPEAERHIVHRGDILSRTIRDNFGGPMRAVLFWWLVATQDRNWFARFMERYGNPFLVGKADVQQTDTVQMLQNAFALSTSIGGLVIDRRAAVEMIQASCTDGANSHKMLIELCNAETSKLVIGQTLSATPEKTGLGSSMGNLHGEVRQDFKVFDMRKLCETLKSQLFRPYLRINGYRGNPPDIIWGGEKEGDAELLSNAVNRFYLGGLEPTDEGISTISQRVGYGLQRRKMPDAAPSKAKAGSAE